MQSNPKELEQLAPDRRDEALAVLLASLTRLEKALGVHAPRAHLAKRPRATLALVIPLALQDRCDQRTADGKESRWQRSHRRRPRGVRL